LAKCDHMLSRENDDLPALAPANMVECMLEEHHEDDHLALIEKGRYISWRNDDDCGCSPEDGYCGCYIYAILDESEANKLLGKRTR
jgi:hypothetical protein